MPDLKHFWPDPPLYQYDAAGEGITSSGGDPNVSAEGTSALTPIWSNPSVPTPGGSEDPNTVSGLPSTPARWEPTETPPEPPSLQDRNPGTIDQR